MNKSVVAGVILVLGAGGYAAYTYLQQEPAEPEETMVETPAEAVDTGPKYPLSADPVEQQPPLPQLEASDAFVLAALNTLLANDALADVFIDEKFIYKFVASIDNLTSKNLPVKMMPIKTAQGLFVTAGEGPGLSISPANAARYSAYMNVVDAADTQKLVQLYIRLYPLFQQAYEELGYPNKYFNDRLIAVIDDLLAAPDINEPVMLVQPLVVYKYADPDLENRNIGQRIMMRIGSRNEARLKTKLRDIKQEVLKHVGEMKS